MKQQFRKILSLTTAAVLTLGMVVYWDKAIMLMMGTKMA